MASSYRDITGQTFGRLTALTREPRPGSFWRFSCACGGTKTIRMNGVVRGAVRSCGCLHMERCKTGLNRLKHGAARVGQVTRLHNIWRDVLKRCKSNHPRYGGRGIFVCDEWADDFAAFQKWSMANGYRDDLTIDRIDNDGPYAPGNCQWTDRQTQARNRRTSRHITIDGRTQVLTAWLAETGGNARSFYNRIGSGLTEQQALFPDQ